MSKYITKMINSSNSGSTKMELYMAEKEVEELIADGWVVESSRCNVIKESDVYLANPHGTHAEEYDLCWILKKEVSEESKPLYS